MTNAVESARSPRPGARGLTLALSIAVFALAWALRQRAFHGLDAQFVIGMVRDGLDVNYSHPLYLPLMRAWYALVEPSGATPFAALRLASALGVAVGAAFLHRAGLALGLSAAAAAWAVVLACCTPAVLFFATVVELHGVFFAFSALAFWQWARGTSPPEGPAVRLVPALLLGACTGVAAGIHSSGHALPWLLAALAWGRARPASARGAAGLLALLLCSHLLTTWAISHLVPSGPAVARSLREAIDEGVRYWGPRIDLSTAEAAGLLWREWIVPFAPLPAAVCAALAVRSQRRAALALLAGIAPFVVLCWLLLHRELYERGAYLLPFAWPAAVLVVVWWPLWARTATAALSLALAVGQIVRHDRTLEQPRLATALGEAVGDRPAFLLCLDIGEVEQALRDLPTVTPRPLDWLAVAAFRGYEPLCAELDAWVEPFLDAGVWITPRAMHYLETVSLPVVRRLHDEHLASAYRLSPLDDPAFPAVRLERR